MNLIPKNACLRSGAYILIDHLVQNGVEQIFGYPGGAILPIYDELYYWEKANLIQHILVRHEQAAVHAADGYARCTNKPGVCFATSGPGATNLITGIANARMDSIPIIVITGQVGRTFIGTDAFQETDIFGITLPIVKHSYTLRDTSTLPYVLAEAFFLAQNGRPGPILIDIPKDVGLDLIENHGYRKQKDLYEIMDYRTDHQLPRKGIKELIRFWGSSYQPLLYVGGGIVRSNAFKTLLQMSKLFQIPVTTTLMGKGAYNEDDHLSVGMLGMHGTAYGNFSVSECDLLITLGARFDDRVTGKLEEFAWEAEVIHLEIDPAEINKNRTPVFSVLGDLRKLFLQTLRLLREIAYKRQFFSTKRTSFWLTRVYLWKDCYPLLPKSYLQQKLSPQEGISLLGKKYKHAFFTTDVGQHQMWAAQLINCEPKKWVTSAGLGTMGFGVPAAIGTTLANPDQDVICISGDSSFQMNIQELGTISQYELNIKTFIINNGWQGMVRQWQESFYGNRFSNSYMRNGMPNFVDVAKAYNLIGYSVNTLESLENVIDEIKDLKTGILIDVNVIENENCYPMVKPGKNNAQMEGLIEPIGIDTGRPPRDKD